MTDRSESTHPIPLIRVPRPSGTGGRHHITATTRFEHLAIHLARVQLDQPEAYQRMARQHRVAA